MNRVIKKILKFIGGFLIIPGIFVVVVGLTLLIQWLGVTSTQMNQFLGWGFLIGICTGLGFFIADD